MIVKNAAASRVRVLAPVSLIACSVFLASCQSGSKDPGYTAAMRTLYNQGVPKEKLGNVAVVDFTKSSTKKRLTIYDTEGKRQSRHLVAHGYGSGMKYAEKFSNTSGSGQSSLGLYQIGRPYYGKHGKSLKLHGLESDLNGRAYSRAIVMHSADYVSNDAKWENFWAGEGYRIGRSAGCPAVSKEDMKRMLEVLPTGSFLYVYAGQKVPLRQQKVEPDGEEKRADEKLHMLAAGGADSDATGVAVKAKGSDGRVVIATRKAD